MHVQWCPVLTRVRFVVVTLSVCAILSAASACRAERFGQPLTSGDKAFFIELQHAVNTRNIDWLVSHVSFPLAVSEGDTQQRIFDAKEFKSRYDEVFDVAVKREIAAQAPEGLFKNWRGLMVGDGVVWFEAILDVQGARHYFITTINKKPHS